MKRVLIGAVIILLIVGFVAWKFSRFGYETAEYEVITESGPFEVRQYTPMVVANTGMNRNNPNGDGSFMRLFRYISKDNQQEQKIAMTTPVFMSEQDSKAEMSFVVPKKVAQAGAPQPKSDQVEVKTWDPGKVAVYRFSGGWDLETRQKGLTKLKHWMAEQNLAAVDGANSFGAGYDPPFTPKFMRRNEVFIPIQ